MFIKLTHSFHSIVHVVLSSTVIHQWDVLIIQCSYVGDFRYNFSSLRFVMTHHQLNKQMKWFLYHVTLLLLYMTSGRKVITC